MTTSYRTDYAAQLAFFLLDNVGSILGTWRGRLTAKQQIKLFGQFIGKGTIIINGDDETIRNRVKVCFGHDYDDRNVMAWKELV